MLPDIGDSITKLYLAIYLYETNILTLLKFREKIVKRSTNRELHDLMCDQESESESEKSNSDEDNVPISPPTIDVNTNNIVNNISIPEKKFKQTEPKENLLRRKRKAMPRDLRQKTWKEVCYICNDYGELICCDGCTNVAHLFCTCLHKVPEEWYCAICEGKGKKFKNN
jgi:hypothetical protein